MENSKKTKEPQYQFMLENKATKAGFGLMSGQVWHDDPKRLGFVLSRYKFVSKMLAGKNKVLEIGCADAFASRIVAETVGNLTAIDFDEVFIENAVENFNQKWPVRFIVHDISLEPFKNDFDAAYALDVIEHITPENEHKFMENVVASLSDNGICIMGSPSLESQQYASKCSREGHVNCKTAYDFKSLMEKHFDYVFIFSMNDEVVHTGFDKMSHYRLALACGPKRKEANSLSEAVNHPVPQALR
jgi:cyclopropane fatty-acyl-phospholipid synthase-like methyltransferase